MFVKLQASFVFFFFFVRLCNCVFFNFFYLFIFYLFIYLFILLLQHVYHQLLFNVQIPYTTFYLFKHFYFSILIALCLALQFI